MKILILIIFYILLSHSIYADNIFKVLGKIKCELSATFIIFDFNNKIAIRNNYNFSKYKISNYETKKNKFKENIYTFSWYDLDNNFLGYWTMSEDIKKIREIKFEKNGNIYSIERKCTLFNKNNNIGELIWK